MGEIVDVGELAKREGWNGFPMSKSYRSNAPAGAFSTVIGDLGAGCRRRPRVLGIQAGGLGWGRGGPHLF
jgi:hypothetical protein